MAPKQVRTEADAPALGKNLSTVVPWAAVLGLVLLVVVGLATGTSNLLEWSYPLVAFAVGVLLYWRYPVWYLGFTWWLWFLTPEVRRLVDYQQGPNPQSLVQLAPFLVTALAFFTLLRHLPKLQSAWFFPFALALCALFYGYIVGIFTAGPFAATFALLNWLVPVLFAFHLAVHWRSYPRYRWVILHTFLWGVAIMGLYGLLQFFILPEWDRVWMQNSGLRTIGSGLPFEVRVFSTLNSPGPFAIVMMAGLLLLLEGGGRLRWPVVGLGYAAFMLSLVRSAWGGWVVGALFLLVRRGSRKVLLRLLLIGPAILLVTLLSLIALGSVSGTVNQRLQTVAAVGPGSSFATRADAYLEVLPRVAIDPLGTGLGSIGVPSYLTAAGGAQGGFDSGILAIFISLGSVGGVLYAASMVMLLVKAFPGPSYSAGSPVAEYAVAVAGAAQLVFGLSHTGVSGMVLWGFLGLALARKAHVRQS